MSRLAAWSMCLPVGACAPREDGFYWVQLGAGWTTRGAWVVAEREPRGWQVMDEAAFYGDHEFDRIVDPRLPNPDEVQ